MGMFDISTPKIAMPNLANANSGSVPQGGGGSSGPFGMGGLNMSDFVKKLTPQGTQGMSMNSLFGTGSDLPGLSGMQGAADQNQQIMNQMFANANAAQTKQAPAALANNTAAYSPMVASTMQAANINPNQTANNYQNSLMGQLANQSTNGSALAGQQFQANTEANLAAQKAAMAGNTGITSALANRQLANQAAATQQQTAQQSAMMQGQLQLAAQQQLGNVSGTAAGQSLQQAQAQAQLQQAAGSQNAQQAQAAASQNAQMGYGANLANAQMAQQQGQFNTGVQMQQQQLNNQLTSQYMQMGMTADQAQVAAYNDIMKESAAANQSKNGALLGTNGIFGGMGQAFMQGGTMLGGLFTGAGAGGAGAGGTTAEEALGAAAEF